MTSQHLTPERAARWQRPDTIRRLLTTARTVAIVGLSSDPQKASSFVATYLQRAGYRIIPVSPRGGEILGEKVYPDLASIPEPIDIVDVFRPARDCPAVVDQAIAVGARAVWIQLGIVSPEAGERAERAGLDIVMDRCMKMEHGRLAGTLHWGGMNTGVVTARKARLPGLL
ncbi:MAG: CoA-binding protein [Gemmatimonadota bacterium]